ncbi:MAG: cytochrome b/b6 domain-containing protein [Gammaproteobacteria bacterium]|nr:cytochrome b/b6 domain-containing protein [Gammaproteobacteria bacterium]
MIFTKSDLTQFWYGKSAKIYHVPCASAQRGPAVRTPWQDRASRIVHCLFYVVILGMAASGIGMMVLSGAAPIIFGGSTETLPDFWEFRPRVPHGIGARILILLFVLHAGAALHHHFSRHDGLLARMWYGPSTKPD